MHNIYLLARAKQGRDILAQSNDRLRAVFIVVSSHGNVLLLVRLVFFSFFSFSVSLALLL